MFLRTYCLTVCVLAALLATACTKPERPNVLVVTIDTLRADRCSAYGHSVATTPVLTRLADHGTLFRRAYSPTSTTAPSHAALMTSRHPRTLGVLKNGQPIVDEETTLAEVFHDAGYATAAFTSSLPVKARYGFGQGFEHYDDEFTTETASLGRQKSPKAHDRRAEFTVTAVKAWLAGRSDSRPLFVWVHLVDPHAPYRSPEPFDGDWPRRAGRMRKRYDAEVRYADRNLGEILEAFERAEAGAGTIVAVTSDHGEGLGDHNWMSHGINLYEEAVRVPLVVSAPGRVDERAVAEEPVQLMDVAPTLVELAGIDVPAAFHGVDLFGPRDPERPVYLQRRSYKSKKQRKRKIAGAMTAVVRGDSKLINAPEEKGLELYDLARDRQERRNLAVSRPRVAERLVEEMEDWAYDYPMPDREEVKLSKDELKALRALGYVD